MYPKLTTTKLYSILAILCMSIFSCIDENQDINKVDYTIGIGCEQLDFPYSNSCEIALGEIIKLKDQDCVKIDENCNYYFCYDNVEGKPAHPVVNAVEFSLSQQTSDIPLVIPQTGNGSRLSSQITAEGIIYSFSYKGNKLDHVAELNTIVVDNSMELELKFQNVLRNTVSHIESMSISLPDFIEVERVEGMTCVQQNNTYTFYNIPTSSDFCVAFKVSKLHFTKNTPDNYLKLNAEKQIEMEGSAKLSLTINENDVDVSKLNGCTITSKLNLGAFSAKEATGKFRQNFDLGNFGSTKVRNVPDYLREESACLDIYNPQLALKVISDIPMEGKVAGFVTAVKDKKEIANVAIPSFTVKANTTTRICICRFSTPELEQEYDQCVIAPDINNLIRTIPDSIRFHAEAWADPDKEFTVKIGHSYSVTPSFSLDFPLALEQDAVMVYKKEFSGWNDNIHRLDLTESSSLQITADIYNNIPAFVKIKAIPIDINGNAIPDTDLRVEVSNEIKASNQNGNSVKTPVAINIEQVKGKAINKLDGLTLELHVMARSENGSDSVTGIVLNSKLHKFTVDDIKVSLVGKFVINAN